jgi:hypothetical protein
VVTAGTGLFYDPAHPDFLTPTWSGWTTDEEILRVQAELARETDPKKRYARYGDLHGLHPCGAPSRGSRATRVDALPGRLA